MNGVEVLKVEDGEQEELSQPRVTKAQKRRDKKAAQEKERENRIAEAEVQNLQGARHQEGVALAQKLAQKQLQIKEISSDGHCMYRAIVDQLARRSKASVCRFPPLLPCDRRINPLSPVFTLSLIRV